jgi:hypothetical protein
LTAALWTLKAPAAGLSPHFIRLEAAGTFGHNEPDCSAPAVVSKNCEPAMKTLIPVFFALSTVAALAQSPAGQPYSLRLYSLPPGDFFSTGLQARPQHERLGLHLETGDWRFDLAWPSLVRQVPGYRIPGAADGVSLGVSRALGPVWRDSGFWDLGNFSLQANGSYSAHSEDGARGPWTGGLGAAWNFSPASRLGLNYRIEASALPEAPALRSLGLSYGYQFSSGLLLSTSLGRGMSDGAPRWGGGLSISFSH